MKQLLLSLSLVLLAAPAFSQWQNNSFTFQAANRQYRVYVPAGYNASNPASLVLTLHGLGDNMSNFSGIGMNLVADTANIVVVVPQALNDPLLGSSAWNSGAAYMGYTVNGAVDDVAFLSALIDSVSAQYSIDPEKVFACGFSMGGFMTQRLALELNDKVKAFASVAGTFGDAILPAANPGRPVSIAHFHGTSDGTIAYTGNAYGNDAQELLDFWVDNNNCNAAPAITSLPDIAADGYTVEHWVYDGGDNHTVVEHFRVNGANHVWLMPNNDIFYTTEIWKFFNRYMGTLSTEENVEDAPAVFPNPATDKIAITLPVNAKDGTYTAKLTDMEGRVVATTSLTFTEGKTEWNFADSNLGSGVYLLTVGETGSAVRIVVM
jgi:polyhydroxybutyrate depolymerase